MRGYLAHGLHDGQDEDRRRAAGRGSAPDRGGAGGRRTGTARAWRSTPTAASIWRPRSPTPRRWRPTACAGTRRRAIRSTTSCRPGWARSIRSTAGDRREPLLDAGRAQPDPLRRDAPGPRRAPVRLRALLRTGRVPAHLDMLRRARLVAADGRSPRRAPDVAQHGGRAGAGRQRVVPRRLPALRRASPTPSRSRTATSPCRTPRASASRRKRRSTRSCASLRRSDSLICRIDRKRSERSVIPDNRQRRRADR